MLVKQVLLKFMFLLLIVSKFQTLNAQIVEINITEIRSNQGQILIGVFDNNQNFQNEKTVFSYRFNKQNMRNGRMVVQIELPNGNWGISVLDDENSNNKMDYSFIRIPEEGFGFSNYVHTTLSRPHFNDFKFKVNNTNVKIDISIRYF